MPVKKAIFLTVLSILFSAAALKAQEQSDSDSLIRLDYGKTAELLEIDGQSVRKVIGPAQFMHNNTYMLCDTALWNIDTQIIDAMGHVSIIQEGTVLTSDKMVYNINEDLAQFRGVLVQLEDEDRNTLRTSYLDYNTKDSVAVFDRGGSMRDKDGQLIESIRGTYDAKIKLFTFTDDVNMFTDSIFVKTSYLEYESNLDKATFGRDTDAWKEDNMLSAQAGWYDRSRETFFFRNNVHVMNDTQEGWSDSLYFFRNTMDVDMRGKVQVTDSSRNVTGVAGRMVYVDSLSRVTMLKNPAVIGRMDQDGKVDSVFVRADTIVYYTKRMCDVDSIAVVNSQKRLEELTVDPVGNYRAQAAEEARKAAEEAMKNDPNYRPPGEGNPTEGPPAGEGNGQAEEPPEEENVQAVGPSEAGTAQDVGPEEEQEEAAADSLYHNVYPERDSLRVGADSLAFGADSLAIGVDSLAFGVDSLTVGLDSLAFGADSLAAGRGSPASGVDSLAVGVDSLAAGRDSLRFGTDSLAFGLDSLGIESDSLAVAADSLIVPLDTTKVNFLWAVGDVRMYKEDMQMVCDSLEYCDLDSLVRMYKGTVIWNEVTQQYSADSVTVVFRDGRMQKANLMSEAYIVIEEEPSTYYDQIKSVEAIAYFDENGELSRFDALGSATGAFFLREHDVVATANKTDSKMLSATFVDGEIDKVYYFQEVKSDAYPVVQLSKEERVFKGFAWMPEKRPAEPSDITTARIRPNMKAEYRSRPRASFDQTEIYFPGYIPGIYVEIARRDSLERVRAQQRRVVEAMEEKALEDSLARADLLALIDSVTVLDSLEFCDSLALADSLAKADMKALKESLEEAGDMEAADSLATKDSLSAEKAAQAVKEPEKPLTKEEIKALEQAEREKAQAERAAERQRRIDEKEAKWARLDSLDAAKANAKLEKKAEKERAKKRRYLEKMEARNAVEDAALEKYVSRIEAREARLEEKGKKSKLVPDEKESSPESAPAERKRKKKDAN